VDAIISNPIILDRLKRDPMFRETTSGDLHLARDALKEALENLLDRKKHLQSHKWMTKFLENFDKHAQELVSKDKLGEIDLQKLLFPAPGKLSDHRQELGAFLKKYVILPAHKCRGNYFVVCKILYIKQCVTSLHTAPEYHKPDTSKEQLAAKLFQDISGLLHHSHLDLMIQGSKFEVPYFYSLPKPHKTPVGWRPIAATHNLMLAIPQ
jgi:hypothetical protein